MTSSTTATTVPSPFSREWTYREQWRDHLERRTRRHAHTSIQALQWWSSSWPHDGDGDMPSSSLLVGCTRQGEVCVWRVHPPQQEEYPTTTTTTTAPLWRLDLGVPLYAMRWTTKTDPQRLCVAGEGGVWVLDGAKMFKDISMTQQLTGPATSGSTDASSYILQHLPTHAHAQTVPTVRDIGFCGVNDQYCYGAAHHDAFGVYQWKLDTSNTNNKKQSASATIVRTLPANQRKAHVTSLDTTARGTFLVTGDSDGTVRVWDTTATTRDVEKKPVHTLLVDDDDRRAVVACRFWKSGGGGGKDDAEHTMPDWLVVAYGDHDNDGRLVMWHVSTASRVATVDTPSPTTCSFVADDGRIYTGGRDGRVSVWTPFDLQCVMRMVTTSTPAVYALALVSSSPLPNTSGSTLATAGVGGSVDLWNEDGLLQQRLEL